MMKNRLGARVYAIGALIIFYFLLLARRGWNAYFTGDDLTNIAYLHGYGRLPLRVIIAEALSVFTSDYRPVGGVYYRTMFGLLGPHPVPFRIVFFALLIVNIALAGIWFHRLSGSMMAAACAALIYSFHPAMAQLYCDGGTIYEALCVFFVLLVLGRYTAFRERGDYLAGSRLFIIVALFGLALGSKEMAVTVPAALLLYELFLRPKEPEWGARLRPIVFLGLMALVYAAVKILVPNQMPINPGYAPHASPAFIGNGYLHYYRLLTLYNGLSGAALAGGLFIALTIAILLRSRPMIFGLLFANFTLLPVCVIPPRAGFVWYMPMLGLALYGGAAIALIADRLAGTASLNARPVHAALFILLVASSCAFYFRYARNLDAPFVAQQRDLRAMLAAARKVAPTLPHAARILIESDSHSDVWWLPLFLFRLGYRDPAIWVERVPQLGDRYNPGDVSLYDMRIQWDGSQYHALMQAPASGSIITFAVTPDAPDVFGNVRRNQTAHVQLPASFGGCSIDVAYRMPDDELMRGGAWLDWARLDASGQTRVRAGRDAERGRIDIDRIRSCNQQWRPAKASFTTDP